MNPQSTIIISMGKILDLLSQLRQIVRAVDRPDIRSVPELLNKILGNLNATTMCLQLLYWFPRATRAEGWVYKSWRDWQAECNLSPGQVKRVHQRLPGIRWHCSKDYEGQRHSNHPLPSRPDPVCPVRRPVPRPVGVSDPGLDARSGERPQPVPMGRNDLIEWAETARWKWPK